MMCYDAVCRTMIYYVMNCYVTYDIQDMHTHTHTDILLYTYTPK